VRKVFATIVSIITLLTIREIGYNFGDFFGDDSRLGAVMRLLFAIGLIIVSLFLWRSVERKEDPGKFRTYKGPGFMLKDGSVVLRNGEIVPKEVIDEKSTPVYTPPPPGMGDYDSFIPQEPYNPTMLKQPDYEDFFSDKKKAEGMGNVKPVKKEEPEKISQNSLMPDAPIPEMKNFSKQAAPVEFFDELIASPADETPVIMEPISEPAMEAIGEITVPESESSYQYDDPISEMNLDEYLSTDYLSPDKND
jgi:hypothetical protein